MNDLSDPGVLDQLGDQSFSVEVLDPAKTVPEPASGPVLLLAAGAFVYGRWAANARKGREGKNS